MAFTPEDYKRQQEEIKRIQAETRRKREEQRQQDIQKAIDTQRRKITENPVDSESRRNQLRYLESQKSPEEEKPVYTGESQQTKSYDIPESQRLTTIKNNQGQVIGVNDLLAQQSYATKTQSESDIRRIEQKRYEPIAKEQERQVAIRKARENLRPQGMPIEEFRILQGYATQEEKQTYLRKIQEENIKNNIQTQPYSLKQTPIEKIQQKPITQRQVDSIAYTEAKKNYDIRKSTEQLNKGTATISKQKPQGQVTETYSPLPSSKNVFSDKVGYKAAKTSVEGEKILGVSTDILFPMNKETREKLLKEQYTTQKQIFTEQRKTGFSPNRFTFNELLYQSKNVALTAINKPVGTAATIAAAILVTKGITPAYNGLLSESVVSGGFASELTTYRVAEEKAIGGSSAAPLSEVLVYGGFGLSIGALGSKTRIKPKEVQASFFETSLKEMKYNNEKLISSVDKTKRVSFFDYENKNIIQVEKRTPELNKITIFTKEGNKLTKKTIFPEANIQLEGFIKKGKVKGETFSYLNDNTLFKTNAIGIEAKRQGKVLSAKTIIDEAMSQKAVEVSLNYGSKKQTFMKGRTQANIKEQAFNLQVLKADVKDYTIKKKTAPIDFFIETGKRGLEPNKVKELPNLSGETKPYFEFESFKQGRARVDFSKEYKRKLPKVSFEIDKGNKLNVQATEKQFSGIDVDRTFITRERKLGTIDIFETNKPNQKISRRNRAFENIEKQTKDIIAKETKKAFDTIKEEGNKPSARQQAETIQKTKQLTQGVKMELPKSQSKSLMLDLALETKKPLFLMPKLSLKPQQTTQKAQESIQRQSNKVNLNVRQSISQQTQQTIQRQNTLSNQRVGQQINQAISQSLSQATAQRMTQKQASAGMQGFKTITPQSPKRNKPFIQETPIFIRPPPVPIFMGMPIPTSKEKKQKQDKKGYFNELESFLSFITINPLSKSNKKGKGKKK